MVNTLTSVANLIYEGEGGSRTGVQVARVQRDRPLLLAVAAARRLGHRGGDRQPAATTTSSPAGHRHQGPVWPTTAVPTCWHPVTAPLRATGTRSAASSLSIQDDEGYLRLTHRLAGLDVLMYMNGKGGQRLVKNSLGPNPGNVPASGSYTYKGQSFRVITVHAKAFPTGR